MLDVENVLGKEFSMEGKKNNLLCTLGTFLSFLIGSTVAGRL